jgi:hypothetical protein
VARRKRRERDRKEGGRGAENVRKSHISVYSNSVV